MRMASDGQGDRADDGREDAARLAHVHGIGGQELEAQDGQAAAQDEDDDEDEHADRDQGQGPQPDADGLLLEAGAEALHGCFLRLADVALAIVFRIMMMTNRTTPVANRASPVLAGGVAHLQGDVRGQRPDRGQERAGHFGGVAGDHDDGHGLADGPAHAQDDAGDDARAGGREEDHLDRLPAGRAEGDRALAVGRRHGLERVDGDGDDRRQDHDAEDDRRPPGPTGPGRRRSRG